MSDHIKAAMLTGLFFLGIFVFVWLCIITNGLFVLFVILGVVAAGLYALAYGIVTGDIDNW